MQPIPGFCISIFEPILLLQCGDFVFQIFGRNLMSKRVLAFLFTLCFLFSPVYACALEEAVDEAVVSAAADPEALAESIQPQPEKRVAVEYHPDEQKTPETLPTVKSEAVYLADPDSGKVFFEKNAHKKMFPASTTKLLTALLVLENCTLEERAVVSPRAVNLVPAGYVTANLKVGESHTVRTLLQALLIPSANEAAFVLAEHVGGSVEAFASLCNQRAAELGCETLHFVNPNGIHDANHYCSAYDLFLIAKACCQFDTFREIVKTKSFTVPATDVYPASDRTFQNTNSLLLPSSSAYDARCTGIKTGYTPEAGECLVASGSADGLQLISVVLGGNAGANTRFPDTEKLFSFVYDNYAYQQIADKTQPLQQVTVKKATKKTQALDIILQQDIASVAPKDLTPDRVPTKIDLPEELKAPIRKNQVLGNVTYSVDGFTYTADLVAQHDVVKKPYWLYNLLVVFALFVLFVAVRTVYLQQKRKRRRQRR